MNFSVSGDQIIAYQGLVSAPSFVYALNSDGDDWAAYASSSNSSGLPTGLINGTTAVAIPEVDNAIYTGTTHADQPNATTYFLSLIGNPANWQKNDDAPLPMPTGAFTGPNAVTVQKLFASSPFLNLAAMFVFAAGLVILRKRR